MCTEPVQSAPKTTPLPNKRSSTPDVGASFEHELDDPENAFKNISDSEKAHESASFKNLTFAQVTDQIWHFSSVDHGPRCKHSIAELLNEILGPGANKPDTCIGYNTLFVIPTLSMPNGKDLPDGKRLWTWLIQTDDGTINQSKSDTCADSNRNDHFNTGKPIAEAKRRNDRRGQTDSRYCATEYPLHLRRRVEVALRHVRERITHHDTCSAFQ